MCVNQPSALPALFGMTGITVFCKLVFVRVSVAIGAGGKVQADIPGALIHAVDAFLKVALVTRQLTMLSVESEPREIMIERSGIKQADVSLFSTMFGVTFPARTA